MKTRPRLYLDSCCFIDLVKEQVGLLPAEPGRANDVWHLKQLMKAHRNGDVLLLTSFLAVAESVAIMPGDAAVPQDIQDRFRRMMTAMQTKTKAKRVPMLVMSPTIWPGTKPPKSPTSASRMRLDFHGVFQRGWSSLKIFGIRPWRNLDRHDQDRQFAGK